MAFESLSEKFSLIIKKLKGQTRLSEANMDEMLKEVRIALLEADVNFKVCKEFINNVKTKAIGQDVYKKLNPGQMVVSIVHDEIEALLGSKDSEIKYVSNKPMIIMLVGLQGSGKTTTAGKLANLMKTKLNKRVLLAACDVYRPAAIDQLVTIGKKINVEVFTMGDNIDPVIIATKAKEKAYNDHDDVLIIDTAGRLQIDETLMDELNNIKDKTSPQEILLLVDAMSGQDAVNVANAFNAKLALTGIVMSKLDGDARGGAALSIKHLTGLPIKFAGIGEKLTDIDIFHPDRMADRILGMGDIMTLVEKAKENIDEEEMKKVASKMMEGKFDLNDMMAQLRQINKMGNMAILRLLPNMPKFTPEQKAAAEKEIRNFEIIINSMTKEEREDPDIIKNSRKIRIAHGSGKTSADINRVLKKYEQTRDMMKKLNQYKKTGRMPPGMPGMGGFPGL